MKSNYHLTQGHNPPQTSPSPCRIHRQGSDAFLNIAIMLQNSKQEWPPAAIVHYRLHKPMHKRTSVPRGWSWLRHSDSQSCPFFSPLLVRAPCPSQAPECSLRLPPPSLFRERWVISPISWHPPPTQIFISQLLPIRPGPRILHFALYVLLFWQKDNAGCKSGEIFTVEFVVAKEESMIQDCMEIPLANPDVVIICDINSTKHPMDVKNHGHF